MEESHISVKRKIKDARRMTYSFVFFVPFVVKDFFIAFF